VIARAVATVVLLLCGVMNAQQPASRTIEKGDQSAIESPTQAIARTQAEWAALWNKHNFNREPPTVDFSKEMVVAVFMGSRPNAGYSITIISSLAVKGVLIVRYKETSPAPGTMSAQILTFPYHIVAVPKAEVTDVRFEKVA
jgi:hypothetical protein